MNNLVMIFFVFVLSILNSVVYSQSVTWQKVLDYTDNSALYKAQQTSDGGYIVVGDSRVGINDKIILVKFNKYGDTLWNKYFDLSINAGYMRFGLKKLLTKVLLSPVPDLAMPI